MTEYDYENIKVNQKVTVKSLNQSIKTSGKIYLINQLPNTNNEESGISTYSFYVRTDNNIHYGYNVQISLDLNQMKIPKDAVIREGNNYFIYKYLQNKVYKTNIKIKNLNGFDATEESKIRDIKILTDSLLFQIGKNQ